MLSLLLFLITIISRIPFTSRFLYHMDSVHFALALDNYNVALHQPHPPGYFLYIMLGRLFVLFTDNANMTFIMISVLFSGLTIVAVYYAGSEFFGKKAGLLAALIALTSPNMWFHGEVALTYIVEAFFSTVFAFLCWKVHKGNHRFLLLSAITLAAAGGVRQNTAVFLFPLWLFSIKDIPLKRIVPAIGLFGMSCLFWFFPMVIMTGGWDVYTEAFRELWLFNTGHHTVFDEGLPVVKYFASSLYDFTLFGITAGLFPLLFTAYVLVRRREAHYLDTGKVLFFILWIVPAVLFYLMIFIHPANPGYVLIFLPALIILIAASMEYMSNELKKILKKDFLALLFLFVIVTNLYFFFFSSLPFSYNEIRNHEKRLTAFLNEISRFDPADTALFSLPYVFYGPKHFMYYLPEYYVYQVDTVAAPTGEIRKTFWGRDRKTVWDETITLPGDIKYFITTFISDDIDRTKGIRNITIKQVRNTPFSVVHGDITLINSIYPRLKMRLSENEAERF